VWRALCVCVCDWLCLLFAPHRWCCAHHSPLSSLTHPLAQEPGELEGELLCGLSGINLCCDVFGAHSAGEVAAGLCFHGEAGLTTWEVREADRAAGTVTLAAHLRRSELEVSRTFSLDGAVLSMAETLTNLAGFERALGRAQHVTVGDKFMDGGCSFRASCDKGMTWPEDEDPDGSLGSKWKPATAFEYPDLPLREGGTESWCEYPRNEKSSDLATMRVSPGEEHGWFVAERAAAEGAGAGTPRLAFATAWERATFPWLMTWEENRSRASLPWAGKTLCRGLEISSYAFATSKRDNVERGSLFDTPCFEWLDANEAKSTVLRLSLQAVSGEESKTGLELVGL